jgi:hypothetical protein
MSLCSARRRPPTRRAIPGARKERWKRHHFRRLVSLMHRTEDRLSEMNDDAMRFSGDDVPGRRVTPLPRSDAGCLGSVAGRRRPNARAIIASARPIGTSSLGAGSTRRPSTLIPTYGNRNRSPRRSRPFWCKTSAGAGRYPSVDRSNVICASTTRRKKSVSLSGNSS